MKWFLMFTGSALTGSTFFFLDMIFPVLRHFFRHVSIVTLLAKNQLRWVFTVVQVGLLVIAANFAFLTRRTLCHGRQVYPVLFRDGSCIVRATSNR